MKRLLALVAVLAALAVPAGTVKPEAPTPAVSGTDAVIDTRAYPTYAAEEEVSIDTIIMGWAWSPWPGIYINTQPVKGLYIFIN